MVCTFVTRPNTNVKGPHEMSMITFNLSNQFFFFRQPPISHCSFLNRQIQSPAGTQNEGESSHFAIASKSTSQKVTGGNCWLHPLLINMKLKISMYFFFHGCTYLCCAPISFAPSWQEQTLTTSVQEDFCFSEFWSEIQNTQKIKRTFFNKTEQDKTCKFSMLSFSSYVQYNRKQLN